MRIGLITSSFLPSVGGLEWKVHYLATEYARHGHEVVVFSGRPPYVLGNPKISVETIYDLRRCTYSLPGFGRLNLGFHLMRRAILAYHARTPLDVLHCHHLGMPTQVGAAVRARTGVPVVATTCGKDVQMLPEINYGDRLTPRLDRIVRRNVASIDVVGSISSAVRSDLESLNPEARIVDIPNGVLWDDFQGGERKRFREKLALDETATLILSVGRNHIKKGYALGLAAFAKATKDIPNAHYALVGRGVEALAPTVEKLALEGRVSLVGQVPMAEMPHVYHGADIFFNPSFIEGFAQVNAQALACSLPLVITDAPGNVDAGMNGGAIIARSGDSTSMAEALRELLVDSLRRKNLAQEAHEISRRYAWSQIAEEYLGVFDSLVAPNRSA